MKRTIETNVCNGRFKKDFDSGPSTRSMPAYGYLWNVMTDSSLIDFDKPNFWRASTHNGWIQTDLATMLLQLAFVPEDEFGD